MSQKDELLRRIGNREARVGIVGLGYVGLPLAVEFAEVGFHVIGVDVSAEKVALLNSGKSYVGDIPSDRLAPTLVSGLSNVRAIAAAQESSTALRSDGTVWAAAHPKVLALIQHFGDATKLAPTQIFRLTPGDDVAATQVEQVYLNLGEEIAAGSVGTVVDRQLLIGSITERKLLRCRY